MGLFDALSAGLGAAAPVGAGLAQGGAQAAQSNVGFLEKLGAMQQAAQKANLDRQVAQAQIGDIQAQQQVRAQQAQRERTRLSDENVTSTAQALGVTPQQARAILSDEKLAPYFAEKVKAPTYSVRTDLTVRGKNVPVSVANDGTMRLPDGSVINPQDVGVYKAPEKPEKPTLVQGTDANGKPVLYRVLPGGGPATPVEGFQGKGGGAKGQATGGALANRQKDYVALMEQGLPDMQKLSAKVDPYLISLAVKSPIAANPLLGDNEQQYLASARNFLAGVLHEESGARLSDAQLQFGIQRYIPIGGDSPAMKKVKLKNAEETMEARRKNINYVPPGAPLSPQAQSEMSTGVPMLQMNTPAPATAPVTSAPSTISPFATVPMRRP